jgi:myo-inositol-1(or 4)-monophosphatase
MMTSELRALQNLIEESGRLAVAEKPNRIVELKGDRSLVTNVDKLIEEWLRERLPTFAPGTSVWGEEFGREEPAENGIWLVDPIDGTSNFSYGSPLWGISVALQDSDGLGMGVIVLPEMNITLSAQKGNGSYWNNDLLPAITAGPVEETQLVSINESATKSIAHRLPGKPRLSGAFVVDGAFTVKQWYRALIGKNEMLYDVAASVLAARELGATITYLDGSEWSEFDLVRGSKIDKPWGILPQGSGFVTDKPKG